jgi:hypothetical protein
MTELVTRILADGTNLLQHVLIWKSFHHTCSCLLCHYKEMPPPMLRAPLIPPPTSSDLQLLHSKTNAIRLFQGACITDIESQFRHQLVYYLGFELDCITESKIDIVVVVGRNAEPYKAKQVVIINHCAPIRPLLKNEIYIWLDSFIDLLQMLLHVLFVTKHRIRAIDITDYFPQIHVETTMDRSLCLFL